MGIHRRLRRPERLLSSMAGLAMASSRLATQWSRPAPERLSVQNGTASQVAMKSKGTFILEVSVGQNEPSDSALRRFRRAVTTSGIMPEVRRRRYFENTQDMQKRKVKELRKFPRPPTWEESQSTVDPAPFADMFGEPDDI